MIQYRDSDGEMIRSIMSFSQDENHETRAGKCTEVFGLQGDFELEMFDSEFKEYVRLGASQKLENGTKLNLVGRKSAKADRSKSVACYDDGDAASVTTAKAILILDVHHSTASEAFFFEVPVLEDGLSAT